MAARNGGAQRTPMRTRWGAECVLQGKCHSREQVCLRHMRCRIAAQSMGRYQIGIQSARPELAKREERSLGAHSGAQIGFDETWVVGQPSPFAFERNVPSDHY